MPINYLYPVGTEYSFFQPLSSSGVHHTLIDEGASISDPEYIYGNFLTAFASGLFLLDDNGVTPSSVIVELRASKTDTLTGLTADIPRNLSLEFHLYDSEYTMIASGGLDGDDVDAAGASFSLPMTVLGGYTPLTLSDLSVGVFYQAQWNVAVGPTDPTNAHRTAAMRLYGFDVYISGDNIPEADSITLFMQGPCLDRGELEAETLRSSSSDRTVTITRGINWGIDSLRFGIPNFGNTFTYESGFANSGEAAFYGSMDIVGNGQTVDSRIIDGVEFWTNYSSGFLKVSGTLPEYFYDNIPFIGNEENVITFSGAGWNPVEVRVDDVNNTSDFRFPLLSNYDSGNYVRYRPVTTSRSQFITSMNEANGLLREYPFNNVFNATDYSTGQITRSAYNLVTNDMLYSTGGGIYKYSFDNADLSLIIEQSGIVDVDVSYEDNKLYYVTPDAIYSCNLMGASGEYDHEATLPTTLAVPRLSVFNPSHLVVGSISGGTYVGVKNSGLWNFSSLPISGVNQYDVESLYLQASSTAAGTVIACDNNVYHLKHQTGFYSDITPVGWFGSGLVGLVFDESTYYYALHGTNTLRAYNWASRAFFNQYAPLTPTNHIPADITTKQNKNYINTSSGIFDLDRLGNCCNAAPSGFIQLEAGYSDPTFFGYPDGYVSVSGQWMWRGLGNDTVKIDGLNSFSTVGYHDYEIDGAEAYDYWRNAQINIKIHNFRDTLTEPAPTGFLSIYGLEYRYEDCFIGESNNDVDLVIVAGSEKEDITLYTQAATENTDTTTLFTAGGIQFDSIPLYINSHISTDDNIELFIDSKPDAEFNLFIMGTAADEIDSDATLFTKASTNDSIYDTCTLVMTAGFDEAMNLFIDAGSLDDTANMNLFVGGTQLDAVKYATMMIYNTRLADSGDIGMVIQGPTGSGENTDMILHIGGEYAESGQWDGEQALVINNRDGDSESANLFIAGAVEFNDNASIYISGRELLDDNVKLYTHGF